jgi:ribulose 1,5-bisphosphate synthetase/thiazole synthase
VAMLTERLDHHRGRGQQQIVVKHVTVNADQALVTDTVVTGRNNEATTAAKLVAASADRPIEIIERTQKEGVPVGGGSKAK